MSKKRKVSAISDLGNAVEAIGATLRSLGCSELFPTFGPSDAVAVTQLLLDAISRDNGSILTRWQLVQLLADVLLKWSNASEKPLPHALCLVAQSCAIRDVSADSWGEGEDSDMSDIQQAPRTTDGECQHGNPLLELTADEMAKYLVMHLKENKMQLPLFRKLTKNLGATELWGLLEEANRIVDNEEVLVTTADGSRPRTAGAIFMRLAKKREAEIKKHKETAAVEEFVLRPYQQEAVDRIWSDGGNWVVSAPTNSGKTAIFIEVTKLMLQRKPSGKALVLVPTIALVTQQCTAYEEAGFRGRLSPIPQFTASTASPSLAPPASSGWLSQHHVDWFCSDRQLPPHAWAEELQRLSVLVMECGSFRNLLMCRAAKLEDFDLLVLDECHHTAKDHPYAVIMSHYKPDREAGMPQVLGVSASPAGGGTVGAVQQRLGELTGRLHAKIHVVKEHEVQQEAPAPEEQVQEVAPRPEEEEMHDLLRLRMVEVALQVGIDLQHLASTPCVAPDTLKVLLHNVCALEVALQTQNAVQSYNLLLKWATDTRQLSTAWKLVNLGFCMHLLEVLRRACELILDVGRECALQFLGWQVLSLATRSQAAAAAGAGGGQAVAVASRSAAMHVDGNGNGKASVQSAQRQRAENSPSAMLIAAGSTNTRSTLLAATPSPGDIKTPVLQLLRSLLQQLPGLGDSPSTGGESGGAAWEAEREAGRKLVQETVGAVVPGWLRPPPACHPKIWALVEYLKRYRDQEDFHGIIFSKTRQGAHYIAEVLRAASKPLPAEVAGTSSSSTTAGAAAAGPLGFIQGVYVFVGHGSSLQQRSGWLGTERASSTAHRGMSAARQQSVLVQFKVPGRRLLVATTAAEEGMDVQCCEFVVRFSPAASGIQRVQARGRGRKLGSVYFCLLQTGEGMDEQLHSKSAQEEEAMRQVLAMHA